MNINEMLSGSLFFGMILSLIAYKIGFEVVGGIYVTD